MPNECRLNHSSVARVPRFLSIRRNTRRIIPDVVGSLWHPVNACSTARSRSYILSVNMSMPFKALAVCSFFRLAVPVYVTLSVAAAVGVVVAVVVISRRRLTWIRFALRSCFMYNKTVSIRNTRDTADLHGVWYVLHQLSAHVPQPLVRCHLVPRSKQPPRLEKDGIPPFPPHHGLRELRTQALGNKFAKVC